MTRAEAVRRMKRAEDVRRMKQAEAVPAGDPCFASSFAP